jgi:hypothetical protein
MELKSWNTSAIAASLVFVCFDQELADAPASEGIRILT